MNSSSSNRQIIFITIVRIIYWDALLCCCFLHWQGPYEVKHPLSYTAVQIQHGECSAPSSAFPTCLCYLEFSFFNLILCFSGCCLLQFEWSSAPRKINLSLSSSTFIQLYLYRPCYCLRTKDISAKQNKFFFSYSCTVSTLLFLTAHHSQWTYIEWPSKFIFTHTWLEIRSIYASINTQNSEDSCI